MRYVMLMAVLLMLAACANNARLTSDTPPTSALGNIVRRTPEPEAATRSPQERVTPGANRPAAEATRSIPVPTMDPALAARAEEVIQTFARQELGVVIDVRRAGGAIFDNVTLPASVATQFNASLALAGETYAAVLRNGAASVSMGTGTLSGEVSVDINSASLGAVALNGTAVPETSEAALETLKALFPVLAPLEFTPLTAENGFAFSAKTSEAGIDPRTQTATTIAKGVIIGIAPTARGAVVYAIVGSGDFAASLVP